MMADDGEFINYWYWLRVEKVFKKYIKDYDKNKESSYLQYWDINNLYGWEMLQKLPVNNFELIKGIFLFDEDFIKNYNEESDKGCFLEEKLQCVKKLHGFHNDVPSLSERMKIGKVEKLVTDLLDKAECVIRRRKLKQALNHGIVF